MPRYNALPRNRPILYWVVNNAGFGRVRSHYGRHRFSSARLQHVPTFLGMDENMNDWGRDTECTKVWPFHELRRIHYLPTAKWQIRRVADGEWRIWPPLVNGKAQGGYGRFTTGAEALAAFTKGKQE